MELSVPALGLIGVKMYTCALCAADPAVQAGRLVCDIHGWWTQQGVTLK
jgi:hypothetical protein